MLLCRSRIMEVLKRRQLENKPYIPASVQEQEQNIQLLQTNVANSDKELQDAEPDITEEKYKPKTKPEVILNIPGKTNEDSAHTETAKVCKQKSYSGLVNQGATCYLNAVLQTLFMTEEFRKAVDEPKSKNNPVSLQLFKLFGKLQYENGCASTEGITKTLDIRNVCEQKDAAEYFQKILNMVGPEMSKVFRGIMKDSITCLNQTCKAKSLEKENAFVFIPVPMQSQITVNVQNCINSHFKSTEMSGVYCETCKSMTDIEKAKFPPVLVLHLQRFSQDYRQMKYVKNNASAEIPFRLLLVDRKYDLYGIVNHRGTLTNGHYYAEIKSFDDQQWYQFNDSSVTMVILDPMKYEVPCDEKHFNSKLACLLLYKGPESLPEVIPKEDRLFPDGSITNSKAKAVDNEQSKSSPTEMVVSDGNDSSMAESAVVEPQNSVTNADVKASNLLKNDDPSTIQEFQFPIRKQSAVWRHDGITFSLICMFGFVFVIWFIINMLEW
ncbi:hypothetical protein Q8A67_006344 [Cirrhinus molitorella]|uniref:Ubiquitin carboxyl-terminal hydrolase n=1 Tax=Cirrhinus molitorella TaxID=172907 RepID=A0AA88TUL0_9TELE|nr:hypothetical protein Q8A67_006344 [Cirrhinus molitorella]